MKIKVIDRGNWIYTAKHLLAPSDTIRKETGENMIYEIFKNAYLSRMFPTKFCWDVDDIYEVIQSLHESIVILQKDKNINLFVTDINQYEFIYIIKKNVYNEDHEFSRTKYRIYFEVIN